VHSRRVTRVAQSIAVTVGSRVARIAHSVAVQVLLSRVCYSGTVVDVSAQTVVIGVVSWIVRTTVTGIARASPSLLAWLGLLR